MVRWPGVIKPGSMGNEIISNQDWFPTLMAALGEPDIKEKLLQGHRTANKEFKVHLDGYNFLPYFKGEVSKGPRKEFFYFTDDGNVAALRYNNWKILFLEQCAHGFDVWADPFVPLRFPRVFNLRSDPFERAMHESIGWG